MTEQQYHIIAISGSLRKRSYNRAALREIQNLLPSNITMEILDLDAIPLFNEDFEVAEFPESVRNLRNKIADADGMLIATPEYNSSISGVLKNALDWISRSPHPPMVDKPVGILGVTTGKFGTARAQVQLRQVLIHLNAHPMNKPEVLIAGAKGRFDSEGRITDDLTKQMLKDFLEKFMTWTRRLSKRI